jgi:hypothetical protein
MTQNDRRALIFETLDGLAEKFLIHDRKHDPLLPQGQIEEAVSIQHMDVTIAEMALHFEQELRKRLPHGGNLPPEASKEIDEFLDHPETGTVRTRPEKADK